MKGVHLRPPHETEFRDIEQIEASWAHVADAGYSAFQAAFHKDWLFLLICDGVQIVGYMCLILKDGEIFRIAIDDRYRGKGYGTWALDAERVAAGRPRIGFETDHKSIPNEIGVLHGAVHMKKGCYRGQETVAKIYNLGNPPRRIVMLHLDGSDVGFPAKGTAIENDGVKVGFIGTVARHHELGTIALAIVKRNTPTDATLTIDGIPASQQVIV